MAKIGYRIKTQSKRPSSIYVYVRPKGSKSLERRTGLSIHNSDWSNTKQRAKKRDGFSTNLNTTLNELTVFLEAQINKDVTSGKQFDILWLKKNVDEFFNKPVADNSSYIVDFLTDSIDEINSTNKKNLQPNTIKNYVGFRNLLNEFEVSLNQKIKFENLDKKLFDQFFNWLYKIKKFKPTQIPRVISRLKSLCKEAESYDIKVNKHYSSYKVNLQDDKKIINIINQDEIILLKKYKPSSKSLLNVRNWMLIGLYIGQRLSDLKKITPSDIKLNKDGHMFINIIQKKTNKEITVGVKDNVVKDILTNHFPYPIADQNFNNKMKEVCKEAGIQSNTEGYCLENKRRVLKNGPKYLFLSSHDLRRSFATNHFNKGLPVYLIMYMTGHNRESTFFEYIGQSQSKEILAQNFLDLI